MSADEPTQIEPADRQKPTGRTDEPATRSGPASSVGVPWLPPDITPEQADAIGVYRPPDPDSGSDPGPEPGSPSTGRRRSDQDETVVQGGGTAVAPPTPAVTGSRLRPFGPVADGGRGGTAANLVERGDGRWIRVRVESAVVFVLLVIAVTAGATISLMNL